MCFPSDFSRGALPHHWAKGTYKVPQKNPIDPKLEKYLTILKGKYPNDDLTLFCNSDVAPIDLIHRIKELDFHYVISVKPLDLLTTNARQEIVMTSPSQNTYKFHVVNDIALEKDVTVNFFAQSNNSDKGYITDLNLNGKKIYEYCYHGQTVVDNFVVFKSEKRIPLRIEAH